MLSAEATPRTGPFRRLANGPRRSAPADVIRRGFRTAGLWGVPVMVGALAVFTAVFNIGSVASAAADCAVPVPMPVPTSDAVVGHGSDADCTESALRSAVAAGGHVTFNCGGGAVTIAVTQPIEVSGTVVIDGAGKITLSGGGANRIFVPQSGSHFSVRNLHLTGGVAANGQGDANNGGAIGGGYQTYVEVIGSRFENNTAQSLGGAIYVGTDSSLTIVDSVFTGNKSASGGAVRGLLSPITIVNSTFTGNTSTGGGGAIETDGVSRPADRNGQIIICGSTISHNTSHDDGGGAFLWTYVAEQIVIRQTTFEGNTTTSGSGGAARLSTGSSEAGTTEDRPSLIVQESSFLSNTAVSGGALYVHCAPTCRLTNSTFSGNSAQNYGGAIFGDGHNDNNVTFAHNSAGSQGGALFGSNYVLNNTIFYANAAHNPWGQSQNCFTTGTGNHVLQWLTSGPDSSTGCLPSVISADPQLADPADNGGPTLTIMPAGNSPVIGAGADCEPVDQRGKARSTSVCDLGAVQRSAVDPTPSTGAGVAVVGGQSGRCLDVPSAATANGTQLQLSDCTGQPNQSWTYTRSKELRVYGNKCLDALGRGTTNGTAVVIWDCNGQTDQQWTVNAGGTITGVESGLCLDATGAATGNGTKIIIWVCHGGANQQWSLRG
jgi:predicted outer membrane repeat protein